MDQRNPTPRIGEILLERNWVKPQDLEIAAKIQRETHQPLGQILLQQASVSERHLKRALRWQKVVNTAFLIGSCSAAAFSHYATASDALRTTEQMVAQITANSTAKSQHRKHLTSFTETKDIADTVKLALGTPTWTLLKGEYSVGADNYTEGMRYKANWSDSSFKLDVRYQF